MKTNTLVRSAGLALALLAGCSREGSQRAVFVFPQGDVARGQVAFVALKCTECHRVDGVVGLPAPTVAPDKVVVLGGEVGRTRTYGDLITAVVHPAYERAAYPPPPAVAGVTMPQFNATMTVGQMIDIVTFLHPRYQRLKPLYYDHYSMP